MVVAHVHAQILQDATTIDNDSSKRNKSDTSIASYSTRRDVSDRSAVAVLL